VETYLFQTLILADISVFFVTARWLSQVLSTWFDRLECITLSVHLCLQNTTDVRRASRSSSATAETCHLLLMCWSRLACC